MRGAIIVALTIPFSLLFAAICLDLKHIPANLLSLGALDFGMVVDGAVVMVENIVRHLSHQSGGTKTPAEKIREAAHEVQRPVFYAIGIIITAYLPIFTLQAVEGRLFRPMAWTVAFALLGALTFSMIVAPVLSSFLFRKGAKEWRNPVMQFLIVRYRRGVTWAIHHRGFTVGVGISGLVLALYLAFSGVIGSEFLPHLDEGALWVRGTLAQSAGPGEGIKRRQSGQNPALLLSRGDRVHQPNGAPGRRDRPHRIFQYRVLRGPEAEGTVAPRLSSEQRRPDRLHEHAAREKHSRAWIWGFSQPIEDNMEEAVSGVKGELATKVYGDDLHMLEDKAEQIAGIMSHVRGITDLGVLQVTGQPDLNFVGRS